MQQSLLPMSETCSGHLRRGPGFPGLVLASVLGVLGMLGAGCGLGLIEDERHAQRLPDQGAGPYGKLPRDRDTPADEPYVLTEFLVHLRDPAALRRDDGGYRLWFGREEARAGAAGEIWMAGLPDLTERPDEEPRPVLVPDQPWEAGWVGAPAVLALPDGTLAMFYQGGQEAPAVGRADSGDGGATWQKHAGNPILIGAAAPSAARLPGAPDGGWVLYTTRPDRPGIFRADSTDGLAWTPRPDPVLLPRADQPGTFDHHAVSDPYVVVRRTDLGTLHFGMFFAGADQEGEDATISVGWAGSFDGLAWHRFASPDEPVLDPEGTSEHAPAVLLGPEGGVMFFHEVGQGTQRIAVAIHP